MLKTIRDINLNKFANLFLGMFLLDIVSITDISDTFVLITAARSLHALSKCCISAWRYYIE